jgi:putative acyl-CoA dehydrogenase
MDITTHEVFNQPVPLAGYNLFETNRPLRDALKFNAPQLQLAPLAHLGGVVGSVEMQTHARLANTNPPVLHTHDRFGRRIDEVEFHPSYHALMKAAVGAGLHGTPWTGESASPHVQRAAGFMLFTELEPSILCPISMSYAVTPALRGNAAIHADWGPKLASHWYDPVLKSALDKPGVTMGMGMTEKQGGSDVRANTTRAVRVAGDDWGERYEITGHKWFFSAPMCDAFLVLAQAPAGLSCFFMPRVLPDWMGEDVRNGIRIQRLKDKLGNKANASSEVEFHGASAWLVGEEGRGIPQILEMGTMTRLDCALGTSGLMRQALSLALHHTAQRQAFGKPLIEQPLMKNVLADLALESEAATALAIRLARAFDRQQDEHEGLMARLLTPVAKFWICKRGSHFAQEAMECLGGNGYVEEGIAARAYREAPLNAIWEGSGNVMGLDILRVLQRELEAAEAALTLLAPGIAADRRLVIAVDELRDRLARPAGLEAEARFLAERFALVAAGALLRMHSPDYVADAFIGSRLGAGWRQTYGSGLGGADSAAIAARAGQNL